MLTSPTGWAKRRERAHRRRHAKTDEERAMIRAIRAGTYSPPFAAVELASDSDIEWPVADTQKSVDDMGRQELIAELRGKGQFVPPRIREGTLRRKVQEARDAQVSEAD